MIYQLVVVHFLVLSLLPVPMIESGRIVLFGSIFDAFRGGGGNLCKISIR